MVFLRNWFGFSKELAWFFVRTRISSTGLDLKTVYKRKKLTDIGFRFGFSKDLVPVSFGWFIQLILDSDFSVILDFRLSTINQLRGQI